MTDLFIYLTKATLVTGIIFAIYAIYHKKENFFVLNRVYLLMGLFSALLLPLVNYDLINYLFTGKIGESYLLTYQLTQIQLPEVIIGAQQTESNSINWLSITLYLYLSGVIIGSFLLLVKIFRLLLLAYRSETVEKDGVSFVFIDDSLPVFSFFKYIFIPREMFAGIDSSNIIAHEKIHMRQLHSFDLLLAEILCIVLWFNPFAHLLKKSVRENHEFLADEKVIESFRNPSAYSLLLLEYSSGIKTSSLAHNFSYSLLKRRLHMIKKPKRNLNFGFSVTFVIIAFSLVLFACSQPEQNLSPDEFNKADHEVFSTAEIMPEYPGGMEALASFLGNNIIYPAAAKSAGTEGKVIVNFVVDDKGAVTNVKAVTGIGNGCDEEAVRVVSAMPDWSPGYIDGKAVKVSFNLPVNFSLGQTADKDSVHTVVKTMPQFPGGMDKLIGYLSANIKYPEQAKRDSVTGRVFISFVVEKDGSISSTKVLRGIGHGCDEESLRVIASMPKWSPGLDENGQAVRVAYNIPIKYALQ